MTTDLPKVILIETDSSNVNCRNFIKSLEFNGWNYEIIGTGYKWTDMNDKITLFHAKLKIMDPEQLVILSDSRDVFCVRPPLYYRQMFETFNKPIVTSMEIFCQMHPYDISDLSEAWQCIPLNKYWKETGITSSIRRYVNAGLLSGKVKDLLQFYDWIATTQWKDDQAALGDYANTYPERVATDIDARLLHTSGFGMNIGLSTHKQWFDSPSIAELTGRLGFFLHLPGIEVSLGQKKIYNLVKTLILDMGISSKWFQEGYSYPPPLWDKGFDETARPKKE